MENKHYKTALLIFLSALLTGLVVCITAYFMHQQDVNTEYKRIADSTAFENRKLKEQIGILETYRKQIEVRRDTIYKTAVKLRTIREASKPDTLRFTDSNYCRNLEDENIKLWDLVGIDSLLISNYKHTDSLKSNIIANDSVVVGSLEKALNLEAKNARVERARANLESFRKGLWRTAAILETGILTVILIK